MFPRASICRYHPRESVVIIVVMTPKNDVAEKKIYFIFGEIRNSITFVPAINTMMDADR